MFRQNYLVLAQLWGIAANSNVHYTRPVAKPKAAGAPSLDGGTSCQRLKSIHRLTNFLKI